MVTEPGLGAHHSEYDPTTSRAILSETAGLLKALGFSAAHATLIGGIVPGLLVPVLDPGVDPHIGTTDVDLCLSVALMEGTTGYYQKIQDVLRQAGFGPTDQSWRWRGGKNASITLEFFCPQPPGHPAGKPFRPPGSARRARANLGPKLSAIPLAAGDIINQDAREMELDVVLPDGKGRQIMTLRVTGPASFLTAKAIALKTRDKPKDAYDIVWLLGAWNDGPAGAATAICAIHVWGHQDLAAAIQILADQFRDIDSAGARAYARFMAEDALNTAALDRLAQHAVSTVRELLQALAHAP